MRAPETTDTKQEAVLAVRRRWPPDLHRPVAQRGMTLLEIMIVLAIIALVMGFLVGPRVLALFKTSQDDLARM